MGGKTCSDCKKDNEVEIVIESPENSQDVREIE